MIHYLTRIPGVRRLWRRFPLGSVPSRVEFDIFPRPHYAYGVFAAANLARSLELPAISVVEFGVAGGNGLVALERTAREVEEHTGVRIQVFGFDGGSGMPAPQDYRDLPYVWGQGFYKMDAGQLRSRLQSAQLLLGDLEQTIAAFLSGKPAPLGFIAFDLDYYSSTKTAFAVFAGQSASRLPRVFCYFDDIIWPERACFNDYVGELCAIREYNQEQASRKITPLANLGWMRRHRAAWNEQIYVHHDFEHAAYTQLITPAGDVYRQIPLKA